MELLCASDNKIWAKLQGNCTYEEFECTSDECIDDSLICDGMPDCSDGSDETVSVCASMICSDYSFRCGYGACISVQQVCDKIWDCVDGSDELCSMSVDTDTQEEPQEEKRTSTPTACTIPYENLHLQVWLRGTKKLLFYFDKILQNETVEFECSAGFELVGANHLVCMDNNWYRQWPKCVALHRSEQCLHNRTSCDNGECIATAALCNGVKDCTDGSGETATKCYGRHCTASEFQCKYGACISIGAVCDTKQHCADGSDETLLLCTKDENDFYNILQGGCV
ncbi:modular serine protease-like isoform X1 [Anastrepha obliqua]|uniref:modular serine protease-like isoform X1 n=2 Tax=Anastrepha obliqua TaxID=95512 RepID=UPI00240A8594|nr:modular serine protease-like isoform X1 [Anastrepha obliqua]